jgi:hypothetical protein
VASRLSGLPSILIATGIAGIAAYVVTWWVPQVVGPANYAVFAVFWSALYLIVGALGGIQQEVTRATRPRELSHTSASIRTFALVAAGLVFAGVLGTAPLWVDAVFPEFGWGLVLPLAFGTASYVLVAVLCGSLYGVQAWSALALLLSLDALLRLTAVVATLLFTSDTVTIAWAASVPFLLTLVLLWPRVRRDIMGLSSIDVGYRALSWNISRTLLASAASAALVSGIPLILTLAAPGERPELLATLFLTIALTRAPLIVTIMALQGYLIVKFREAGAGFLALFTRFIAVILLGAVVLAGLGWWLGPPVYALLFPQNIVLDGGFFAILVGSSAIVGAMSVSASAALARSQHVAYTAGWVVAAVVTVLALLLPLGLIERTAVALLAGPLAGLAVHVFALFRRGRAIR